MKLIGKGHLVTIHKIKKYRLIPRWDNYKKNTINPSGF